ncbi:MAG TPA: PilX N-terminal domain-containing pilus assembly protein, partial [Ideonella sp.]|nr:PilX N-terminal domain-containing pilus assembly protein [Ideonella sp.]
MKNRQRGVAALGVALLLLSTMALVALFANRSLLFEQKSAANQTRATRAFELAEAGLEWATAMLNDPRPVDATCTPTAAGLSFRDRYLGGGGAFAPVTTARPSCRIAQGALACSCPEPGNDPALGSGDEPSFGVAFAPVAGDGDSVQLTAWGCTGQSTRCVPGSAQQSADAAAKAGVALKLRPLLRALPVAAVTAAGTVQLGAARLANLDLASHGALVVAGRAIDAATATLQTLAGSPAANTLYAGDAALDRLLAQATDGGAVFNASFGMSPERYRAAAG